MVFRDIIPPPNKKEKSAPFVMQSSPPPRLAGRARGLMYIAIFASILIFALNFVQITQSGLRLKQNLIQSAGAGFEKISNGMDELKEANFETARKLFV